MKRKKILRLEGETRIIEVEDSDKKTAKTSGPFMFQAVEVGFSVALPMTVGALFGLGFDKKFHTQPLFTLTFLGLGMVISFANLWMLVKKFSRKD